MPRRSHKEWKKHIETGKKFDMAEINSRKEEINKIEKYNNEFKDKQDK